MGRWLLGMEMAIARARADPGGAPSEALGRAGDAYERARSIGSRMQTEPAAPDLTENGWRRLGRILATLLGGAPGARRHLEDWLLGPLD